MCTCADCIHMLVAVGNFEFPVPELILLAVLLLLDAACMTV